MIIIELSLSLYNIYIYIYIYCIYIYIYMYRPIQLRTPGLHCTWHAGPRFVALVEGSSLQLPTCLGYSIGASIRLVREATCDNCGAVHRPSLP